MGMTVVRYPWLSNNPGVGVPSRLAFATVHAAWAIVGDTANLGQHKIKLAVGKYKLIVPNSVLFSWNGFTFYDRNGVIYRSLDVATGSGIVAGTIDYKSHIVTLSDWGGPTASAALPVVLALLLEDGKRSVAFVRFRTPGAPLRPASLSVRATTNNGDLLTGFSNVDGTISGAHVGGFVDYENGIVEVNFGDELLDSGAGPFPWRTEPWYSVEAQYQRGGETYVIRPQLVDPSTVLFNTVVYTAIPLDADLIGVDPVRLPTDGRVPIFKTGYVIVVHDTGYTTAPPGLISNQVVGVGRGGQSYIVVRDQNHAIVPEDRFTVDLVAGTVTMGNPINLTGFVQPLILEDRIEDMLLATDVQITGELSVARPLKHAYSPATALVSSALLFGDLQARYTRFFDQGTWANVWADQLIGSPAPASYNDTAYPLEVSDNGAISQRWALVFTSSTAFSILGEDVGLIGVGSTGADIAPANPSSQDPYFKMHKEGWGLGWQPGNVLRFETIGALAPIWFARTTRPGDDTAPPVDHFRIQVRGDAE